MACHKRFLLYLWLVRPIGPSNWRVWVQIQIWKFSFFSSFFHQEGVVLARLDFFGENTVFYCV